MTVSPLAPGATSPLAPGATIGILGGGQLGRMLALAAAPLGLKCHIYCPDEASPAFQVSDAFTLAAYDDEAALAAFADAVDVVTYEFENVPEATARFLEERTLLRPGAGPLAVAQDRLSEKEFLSSIGIPLSPFAPVNEPGDIPKAAAVTGLPAILKTRRMGYDGKGQTRIESLDDAAAAWERIGKAPAVLEGVVGFALECSVLAARGANGMTAAYDIAENEHHNHILKWTHVPASLSSETQAEARALGMKVAEALDYVGVLAVELFVVREDGAERLVANEIAPRVHNSGHWTQDGCLVSQFEQHIRAVAGWPLGTTERRCDVVMENLIGADAESWAEIIAEPSARLHLYGKSDIRPGRKMGHVNRVK
ncbi:5-(carboxyamino)imidazole ribonucleotide synthase [Breoghania corrubedonensis]|uniref:N5-carboxyaminoimidazole ribonucleotide synthase n=1 Tax=Breoghania corrubedonensis TaxID=665038 RepID=A0A2T5V799_9HYPH|nr:5-(carboxyamino)imidazole ribonucleotide synthase [Breoghania corrubedonensis]PTW59633.1 5-(carboxyamino)imidazole ribonucleotide synthase [Breoghania corrubedonensis]